MSSSCTTAGSHFSTTVPLRSGGNAHDRWAAPCKSKDDSTRYAIQAADFHLPLAWMKGTGTPASIAERIAPAHHDAARTSVGRPAASTTNMLSRAIGTWVRLTIQSRPAVACLPVITTPPCGRPLLSPKTRMPTWSTSCAALKLAQHTNVHAHKCM